MANQQIVQALETYTGELDSLNAFVETATRELGAEWTQKIYDDMNDMPDSLRERLDHAFNYYAATTAWSEIQSYLAQPEPLNYDQTVERLPVLEHWLAFFGAAGEEVVTQLQNRLRDEAARAHTSTTALDEPFAPQVQSVPDHQELLPTEQNNEPIRTDDETLQRKINDIFSDSDTVSAPSETVDQILNETPAQRPVVPEEISEPVVQKPNVSVEEPVAPVIQPDNKNNDQTPVSAYIPPDNVFNPIGAMEPAQNDHPLVQETEQSWRVGKMFRQLDFIANIEAWISVRCLELGYTDFYTYRYYGFLVDVLDRTIEDLKELLADTDMYDYITARRGDGVQYLQNRLIAFEKESKEAHEGVLSDLSPLPREGLSVDDLKNRLGGMDLSGEKEYLGPAPDGFEMVEDPYENMDDATLKKEYEKIEAEGNLHPADSQTPQNAQSGENVPAGIKNTSQTPQNGVQRKMSFSLGIKPVRKPGGTGGAAS